jgi:hypothetical protein
MNTLSPTDHDLPPLQAAPPGLYRHYKGGWYEVIDTVRCWAKPPDAHADAAFRRV